ncbi:ribose-phosphate diphosphokinase [Caulobacter sp. KR2-114]|uniref:ribose-phosphate diphosphokinase n=1 Tax=Caulobacter sp. KR2-114 TaxID=3400912 RepID=UPI003C056D9A
MSAVIHAFDDEVAPAARLAQALDLPAPALVSVHRFPDGESLPVVAASAGRTVIVYRSLDRPDGKLAPLLLAADAWRRAGARRLVLVAPYMAYLRQDKVFAPGQPVSRDVIGRLLGGAFDRIVTVEPHLHRTADLAAVFGVPVGIVSAAETLARALGGADPQAVLVGPDEESAPWVASLAARMGARFILLNKIRQGDRSVAIDAAPLAQLAGRRVVLVDDICSSGATLMAGARQVAAVGPASLEAAVAHALCGQAVGAALSAAGVARLIATDSCAGPLGVAPLAGVLAEALQEELG